MTLPCKAWYCKVGVVHASDAATTALSARLQRLTEVLGGPVSYVFWLATRNVRA